MSIQINPNMRSMCVTQTFVYMTLKDLNSSSNFTCGSQVGIQIMMSFFLLNV